MLGAPYCKDIFREILQDFCVALVDIFFKVTIFENFVEII